MRIAYIGNFGKMWDEEYIAQAFENISHDVGRITERDPKIIQQLVDYKPDIILWAKLNTPKAKEIINWAKFNRVTTVCWVWDLYWGYTRQYLLNSPMFKADYVFTTDGGHDDDWKKIGVNHDVVRQGIRKEECHIDSKIKNYDVVFVGTYNQNNKERNEILDKIAEDFDFHWFGKDNADEIRGPKLNRLYGKSKIVVGDSVYSPNYWSNRVVETLGRGGFLIHVEVPGIKEEYPYLVTYKRGDYQDLKNKISHYIQNPEEREEIIRKNYEWVRDNHTVEHKVKELCRYL